MSIGDPHLATRLAEARRNRPESETWLGLLEAALQESENAAAWEAGVPAEPVAGRGSGEPLLHGTRLAVDGRLARRWVRRLLHRAPSALPRVEGDRVDAVALLEAAIRQDDSGLDAIAASSGAGLDTSPSLRVLAQMAALPLLQACGRLLGPHAPVPWPEGYCPVCGAWPVLAEFRGLEHKRWLRCGRCAAGWEISWLRCPFCGETRHDRLGYLAPDEGEVTRKAEVCDSCKGYVKAESTVRALPAWGVLLEDLTTVPLDVAALDRGYHRPDRPGFAVQVHLAERRRGLWSVA